MNYQVLICLDKKGALETRMQNRAAHLEYAASFPEIMRLGGPMLDDDGQMIGSLIVLDCDKATAEAFAAGDPYRKAGLFESVEIRGFKAVRGEIK